MFLVTVLLAFPSLLTASAVQLHEQDTDISINVTNRIMGGFGAVYRQFPYQASLIPKWFNTHLCGAIIVSDRIVLTAAHCIKAHQHEPSFRIMAGHIGQAGLKGEYAQEPQAQIRDAKYFRIHSEYKALYNIYWGPRLYQIHDIAVLVLSRPFQFNANVNKMEFLPPNIQIREGTRLTATGWGNEMLRATTRGSPVLKQVELPYVPNAKCAKLNNVKLMPTQFCAGGQVGKATLVGDSGGPIAVVINRKRFVMGITSMCSQIAGKPGVYTNIAMYHTWIQQQAHLAGFPL